MNPQRYWTAISMVRAHGPQRAEAFAVLLEAAAGAADTALRRRAIADLRGLGVAVTLLPPDSVMRRPRARRTLASGVDR